jgi:hypothetical protein
VDGSATIDLTSDANPTAKFSRGSNNTTNVNYYYNTTLTGQLGASSSAFEISAVGSSKPLNIFVNGTVRQKIETNGDITMYKDDGSTAGMTFDASSGNSSFKGATTTIGSSAASTNVELNLDGVASKAQRIQFREGVTNRWLLGQGAASETSAFELYNATGTIALKFDRGTNVATFASGAVFNENGLDQDFRVESDSNSHMLFVDAGNNRIGINESSPDAFLDISGTGATTSKMFEISTGGVGGGPTDIFYGGHVQVQANNNAASSFGWHVTAHHSGIERDTTGIYGQATMNSSTQRSIGAYGSSSVNSAAVHHAPSNASSTVGAGVYAEAITSGTTNNSTNSALIAYNKSAYGNTAYGAYIRSDNGPTNSIPLLVDYAGNNIFEVAASDGITVNESARDYIDFRVESGSNANMFHIDAEISKAAFGTAPQTAIGGMVHTGSLSVGNGNHVGYSVYSNHEGNIPSNTTVSIMDFEGPAYARYMKVTISGYLCRREVYFAGYQSWDNQTGGAVGDTTVGTQIFANGSNSTSARCSIYLEVLSTSGVSGNPKYRLKLGTGSLSGQLYDTTSVVEFFNPPLYVTYQ